jgi:hypothetical protein
MCKEWGSFRIQPLVQFTFHAYLSNVLHDYVMLGAKFIVWGKTKAFCDHRTFTSCGKYESLRALVCVRPLSRSLACECGRTQEASH